MKNGSCSGSTLTLVTGGAGFIGSNLSHRLLGSGERVRILDNLSRPGV
jgi:CDP-paratose 2-epimerase